MSECIELMSDALASLARGEIFQPLRTIIRPPDARGLLGLMPAYRHGEPGAFGLKAICVFPGNPSIGKDARSEEHTSELQSLAYLVCRLLLEKKKTKATRHH